MIGWLTMWIKPKFSASDNKTALSEVLAVILALTMALSLLPGCSPDNTSGGDDSKDDNQSQQGSDSSQTNNDLCWLDDTSFGSFDRETQLKRLSVTSIGGSIDDFLLAMAFSPDKTIYAAGTLLSDRLIIKVSEDISTTEGAVFGVGWMNDIIVSADGTVFAAGSTGMQAGIVRYDPASDEYEYALSDAAISFMALAQLPDGTIYAAGVSSSDAVVVRYSSALEEQKVVTWDAGGQDGFNSIAAAPDGTLYAAGFADSDALIVRYSANLDAISSVMQENGLFFTLALNERGEIYAAGYSNNDALIAKYTSQLELVKAANWGAEGDESFLDMAITSDGTVYAVGFSSSADEQLTGFTNYGFGDAIAVRYSGELEQQNIVSWGGNNMDWFYAIVIAPDETILVAGYSSSTDRSNTGFTNNGETDAVIIR